MYPPREPGRKDDALDAFEENGKFVATQPRECVFRSEIGLQAGRNPHNQGIPARVAQAVVDQLEAVNIDVENGKPRVTAPAGAGHGQLESVHKE